MEIYLPHLSVVICFLPVFLYIEHITFRKKRTFSRFDAVITLNVFLIQVLK